MVFSEVEQLEIIILWIKTYKNYLFYLKINAQPGSLMYFVTFQHKQKVKLSFSLNKLTLIIFLWSAAMWSRKEH